MWISSNESVQFVTTRNSQESYTQRTVPQYIEMGNEYQWVTLPVGSSITIVAYASSISQDTGKRVYYHAGGSLIPIGNLRSGSFALPISHRGVEGLGAEIMLENVSVPRVGIDPGMKPFFDPEEYFERLYNGVSYRDTSSIIARLNAPFWFPPGLGAPIPFTAFFSAGGDIAPSTDYLLSLQGLGASRLGYTYEQSEIVAANALGRDPGSKEGKDARRLFWAVLVAVPNASTYETDKVNIRKNVNDRARDLTVEYFDFLLQRGCVFDCEDGTRFETRLALHFQNLNNNFGTLMNEYEILGLLGTVTQPSVGTSVKEGTNRDVLGGHMWAALVHKSAFGRRVPIHDMCVILESTGIASGDVDPAPQDVSRINSTISLIQRGPRQLEKFPHEVNIISYKEEQPSLFYRHVKAIVRLVKGRYLPEKYFALESKGGYCGVSWANFLAGSYALLQTNADTESVERYVRSVMWDVIPEVMPQEAISVPSPIIQEPGYDTVLIYKPSTMVENPMIPSNLIFRRVEEEILPAGKLSQSRFEILYPQ